LSYVVEFGPDDDDGEAAEEKIRFEWQQGVTA
jgi:hypothetical protein